MNKNLNRLLAYIIDILIVYLIVNSLSSAPIINKQLNSYNKYYKEYQETYNNYINFSQDLTKYYGDNKLTKSEHNKLIKKYPKLKSDLNKYYKNNKLSQKQYNKLTKKINQKFQTKYKKIYYKLNKYSIIYNVIYITVLLAYFVLFNILTNGQTLGKKIFKLKIINNKDPDIKVSILNYLIRTTILYNPIYYLAMLLVPYFNANNFYTWSLIWSNIKNYLEVVIIVMIIIRKDNRGLHELLSNTKVISLDKKSNELQEEKNKSDFNNSNKNIVTSTEIIKNTNSTSERKKAKNKKKIIDYNSNNKED